MPSMYFTYEGIIARKAPSYLHGHSALSRASSRHSGGKGGHGRTTLIPDTVLPVCSGDRAIRSSEESPPDEGARRTRWSEGGHG
jgi:hypothetical protein